MALRRLTLTVAAILSVGDAVSSRRAVAGEKRGHEPRDSLAGCAFDRPATPHHPDGRVVPRSDRNHGDENRGRQERQWRSREATARERSESRM